MNSISLVYKPVVLTAPGKLPKHCHFSENNTFLLALGDFMGSFVLYIVYSGNAMQQNVIFSSEHAGYIENTPEVTIS